MALFSACLRDSVASLDSAKRINPGAKINKRINPGARGGTGVNSFVYFGTAFLQEQEQ